MINKSEVLEYRVLPNKFQRLAAPTASNGYRAECYLIQKSTNEHQSANLGFGVARKILLTPNKEVLQDVPEEFKRFDKTNIVPEQKHVVKPTPAVRESDNNFKIEHFEEANNQLTKQQCQTQAQIRREHKREELEKPKVETSFDKFHNNKSKFRKKVSK